MRNPRSEWSAWDELKDGQKNVRKDLPVRQERKRSLSFMEAVAGLAAIGAIVAALSSL